MKLKKLLNKTIVAGTIVTASLLLGAVSIYADPTTTTYNFADITNTFTVNSNITNNTELSFATEKPNTITVIKGKNPRYQTFSNLNKVSATTADSTAILKDTTFTKGFYNNSGAEGKNATLKISNIAKNDKIEIYFNGTNSSGSVGGSTASIAINDDASVSNVGNIASTPSHTGTNNVYCEIFKATQAYDEIYLAPNSRAAIFAITVTTGIPDEVTSTLSGTIPTTLASSGKITFNNADTGAIEATIADGSYSVALPQGKTYSISLDSNDSYVESQYTLATSSVTIGTDATQTLNISASEKINKWDFTNGSLPAKTYTKLGAGKTATYKGLTVIADTTDQKFDVKATSAQFNAGTMLKVPLETYNSVVVTTKNSKVSVVYYDSYALLTADKDDYIETIELKSVTTPTIELSSSSNTLTGKIVNANADNKITEILVTKDTTEKAITKLKDNNDETYSFSINVLNTTGTALDGTVKITYVKDDDSETVVYGYVSNADASLSFNN